MLLSSISSIQSNQTEQNQEMQNPIKANYTMYILNVEKCRLIKKSSL